MAQREITQLHRLILFSLDILVLLITSRISFGSFVPPFGDNGFWFYTSLLTIVLGNRLVTPFFIKPVDALSYSVAAVVAVLLVNHWANWDFTARLLFAVALFYPTLITVLAALSIATKDAQSATLLKTSNTLRDVVAYFGDPRPIYGALLLFALYTFHSDSSWQLLWIAAGTIITVELQPFDALLRLILRAIDDWKPGESLEIIGTIAAYQAPDIFLLRQFKALRIEPGQLVILGDIGGRRRIVATLDYVGRDEGQLLRALALDEAPSLDGTSGLFKVPPEKARLLTLAEKRALDTERFSPLLKQVESLVGIVAVDTSIDDLHFEVTNSTSLAQGQLMEVNVGQKPVLYQIVDGITREEIVFQKNTFGYVRAHAQRIGYWNSETNNFEPSTWLPSINAPVISKATANPTPAVSAIGYFPGTSYYVGIADLNDFVTHNTAILGILGIGKSMLAFEAVERMLAAKIKVICLDITDEYAAELVEYYPKVEEEAAMSALSALGAAGRTNCKQNVEDGGSVKSVAAALVTEMEKFLDPLNPQLLKIINPSSFEVWKQDSKPFQGVASMASLTACEITKMISEAVLIVARRAGRTKSARVCLVYEEAHTLVPEWNSAVGEGDRHATNGTARAILQGRKFGMGCLVISQRTANVTKTILNQCNTVFAMRTFDDTGREFLSNYIGKGYTAILPSIPARHAVIYGKASTCHNPVLIRLNDRSVFKERFRAKYPAPAKPPGTSEQP